MLRFPPLAVALLSSNDRACGWAVRPGLGANVSKYIVHTMVPIMSAIITEKMTAACRVRLCSSAANRKLHNYVMTGGLAVRLLGMCCTIIMHMLSPHAV